MKLHSSLLDQVVEATPELLAEAHRSVIGQTDPFLILKATDMTYIQSYWTEDGYVLEYQEESIFNHFVATELLSEDKVVRIMQDYLSGNTNWKDALEFHKKDIAGLPFRLGHSVGVFWGALCRGFKQARMAKEKK